MAGRRRHLRSIRRKKEAAGSERTPRSSLLFSPPHPPNTGREQEQQNMCEICRSKLVSFYLRRSIQNKADTRGWSFHGVRSLQEQNEQIRWCTRPRPKTQL